MTEANAPLERAEPARVALRAIAFLEVHSDPPSADRARVESAVSEAGGEVVQAMHGLVLASFASASACLRLCRGLLPDLRGGVSVGDVLVEAGLLHGLPVVEASRLKDRASPGQLLCLRRLALLTDLPQDAFRDLGELSLEGMSTPVPVWELLRA